MELTAAHVWTIIAAALVLLMTPGLAFFYGGMTRSKAAINMIMMSMISMGLVAVVWVLWGFSMAGGTASIPEVVGSPLTDFALAETMKSDHSALLSVGYSATFAIIAVAIISGSCADRTKFGSWALFVPLWITFVYCPLAFMVWGGGLLSEDGWIGSYFGEAVDFAGGLVIHINAGIAGLIMALVLGTRRGFGKDPDHRPHNLPFVMLGAAILWFGWFGFNAGAAKDGDQAGLLWINTLVAPSAAILGWVLLERIRFGHATSLGVASGLVSGLVAITPACANVSPLGAIVIGLFAGIASGYAVGLKYKFGYDDSLDVVGVHLVSGIWGTLAIGFLAIPSEGQSGLFYGGGPALLLAQAVATVVAVLFSALLTWIIVIAIHHTIGLRVSTEQEEQGLDLALHSESAYAVSSVRVENQL